MYYYFILFFNIFKAEQNVEESLNSISQLTGFFLMHNYPYVRHRGPFLSITLQKGKDKRTWHSNTAVVHWSSLFETMASRK